MDAELQTVSLNLTAWAVKVCLRVSRLLRSCVSVLYLSHAAVVVVVVVVLSGSHIYVRSARRRRCVMRSIWFARAPALMYEYGLSLSVHVFCLWVTCRVALCFCFSVLFPSVRHLPSSPSLISCLCSVPSLHFLLSYGWHDRRRRAGVRPTAWRPCAGLCILLPCVPHLSLSLISLSVSLGSHSAVVRKARMPASPALSSGSRAAPRNHQP
jgi:hypothetical protein